MSYGAQTSLRTLKTAYSEFFALTLYNIYIIIAYYIYYIVIYTRVRARDRVRVCHGDKPYPFRNLPFFAIFLFIPILCCDILLLRLFFVLFVNVSDFLACFPKIFAKKLA